MRLSLTVAVLWLQVTSLHRLAPALALCAAICIHAVLATLVFASAEKAARDLGVMGEDEFRLLGRERKLALLERIFDIQVTRWDR